MSIPREQHTVFFSIKIHINLWISLVMPWNIIPSANLISNLISEANKYQKTMYHTWFWDIYTQNCEKRAQSKMAAGGHLGFWGGGCVPILNCLYDPRLHFCQRGPLHHDLKFRTLFMQLTSLLLRPLEITSNNVTMSFHFISLFYFIPKNWGWGNVL